MGRFVSAMRGRFWAGCVVGMLAGITVGAGAQEKGTAGPGHEPRHETGGGVWQMEPSETTADLRGIHNAGYGVAWASGTHGTVLRSEDSGFEWQNCAMPPGAEHLDFRAIWGWDSNTAVVMSSGTGALSRLYRTEDGCAHWTLLRTNADAQGFWDGIAFSDRNNGYLLGDAVAGQMVLERTEDGGRSWTRIHAAGLNTSGRGAFAASNTSLALIGPVIKGPHGPVSVPWIATGGPGGAVVLAGGIDCGMEMAHSNPEECLRHFDFTQEAVPVSGGSASAGVFSIAVVGSQGTGVQRGVAVGGDYTQFAQRAGTAASWQASRERGAGSGKANDGWEAAQTLPAGYRSAVACEADGSQCIAVGPTGSDVSVDGGLHWIGLESAVPGVDGVPKGGEWNALSLPWAVGPGGRIAKLNPGAVEALIPKGSGR
jgi:hypothetical protein